MIVTATTAIVVQTMRAAAINCFISLRFRLDFSASPLRIGTSMPTLLNTYHRPSNDTRGTPCCSLSVPTRRDIGAEQDREDIRDKSSSYDSRGNPRARDSCFARLRG